MCVYCKLALYTLSNSRLGGLWVVALNWWRFSRCVFHYTPFEGFAQATRQRNDDGNRHAAVHSTSGLLSVLISGDLNGSRAQRQLWMKRCGWWSISSSSSSRSQGSSQQALLEHLRRYYIFQQRHQARHSKDGKYTHCWFYHISLVLEKFVALREREFLIIVSDPKNHSLSRNSFTSDTNDRCRELWWTNSNWER